MNICKSVVVWVTVVAICGCDRSQPKSASAIGMEFKLIPAGTFTMGEGKMGAGNNAHEVTITKPFKMGVHEVTQAQYEQVMGVNPSHFKGANNPVDTVSWGEAVQFCRRLSELPAEKAAGNVYRLPTEAEWEYACRAGTTTEHSFGNDASDFGNYAWCKDNCEGTTHSVGSKLPNAWGLHDMHGNVSEWCQDWYGNYTSGAVTDPTGPTCGVRRFHDSFRVRRGGSWSTRVVFCRSAHRYPYGPSHRGHSDSGFRVSLSSSGQVAAASGK